jgi:hypothetical protein
MTRVGAGSVLVAGSEADSFEADIVGLAR